MGEKASVFGSKKLPASDDEDDSADEQGATVFSSSSWLPGSASKYDFRVSFSISLCFLTALEVQFFSYPVGLWLIVRSYLFSEINLLKRRRRKRREG